MTLEAYLEWEPRQEPCYEYVNGQIMAMTGGTLLCDDIAISLLTILRPQVRAQSCRNIADAKINVSSFPGGSLVMLSRGSASPLVAEPPNPHPGRTWAPETTLMDRRNP